MEQIHLHQKSKESKPKIPVPIDNSKIKKLRRNYEN